MKAIPGTILPRPASFAITLAVLLALNIRPGDAGAQSGASVQAAPALGGIDIKNASTPDTSPANRVLAQQQTELAELGTTNTAANEEKISMWLDKLLAGTVAKELQLDVLQAAGKHAAPAIKEKLAKYRAARLAEGGLATSAELLYGGNVGHGRKLFFEKPEIICIKCHKVGREGGDTGPPLTGATTNRPREFILESILVPNAQITPGYEMVTVILQDRSAHTGVIKNETETDLTLACPPDEDSWEAKVVTVKKADIKVRRNAPSPMPDGLEKTVSPTDLRDIIEFVASLNPGNSHGTSLESTQHQK